MDSNDILEDFWQQAMINFLPHAIEFLCLLVGVIILLRASWLLKKKTTLKGRNLLFFSLLLMGIWTVISVLMPIVFNLNEVYFFYFSLTSIPLILMSLVGFFKLFLDVAKKYQYEC